MVSAASQLTQHSGNSPATKKGKKRGVAYALRYLESRKGSGQRGNTCLCLFVSSSMGFLGESLGAHSPNILTDKKRNINVSFPTGDNLALLQGRANQGGCLAT